MHRIGVGFDGEILAHQCKDYPDNPKKRTNKEDDRFSQARRFARYHVYREKGYDTVPASENPDRIAGVLLALLDLDQAEFEEYFETLCRQVGSRDLADVEPALDLPEEVYNEQFIVYHQHVYLNQDLETIQQEVRQAGSEVLTEQTIQELVTTDSQNFFSKASSLLDDRSLTDLTIEGVSGVHTRYFEDTNEDRIIESDDPFERDPDACIELFPTELTPEFYGLYIVNNLICQIRDCYIGMGVEPPAQYRILGPGKDKYTGKYYHFDFYPEYFNHEADIPGYTPPIPMQLDQYL
ncbi:hypothetical protein C453_01862 [Haloferax elongans ATCC BAA-1513]|uniref:Uncharacterized protein n=1 Tax=Haloferax elongans ATCC BAA-1513 TaxID=1230453 RepID=M0HUL5_HALEO|nr:hypothetical protein [Haloferax elongans]ELZ88176.1 hypothetical protein C453_01862 [Haloferax elongans ATCC BAA-1513]